MTKLVAIPDIRSAFPDLNWPFESDGTYRLIRRGKLGRVQIGRNYFVTRELLEQFVAAHVTHEPRPVTPRASNEAASMKSRSSDSARCLYVDSVSGVPPSLRAKRVTS